MRIAKKIKAGALQYVLVISVLITIILLAFISLVFLQQKIQLKKNNYTTTVLNVQNGFGYLKANNVAYNQEQTIQLTENANESVSILKKHWGIFDLATITSSIKNESFQKTALLGNFTTKRNALYLKENFKPLVLVGNTKIIGNVVLPKQGIKTGNIAGTSFNGKKLFYGIQKLSSKFLPNLKNIQHIKTLYQYPFLNSNTSFFELTDNLKKKQSFFKPTLFHHTFNSVALKNIELTGNIVISSNTKITVHASSTLKDVILIAPEIEISPKVTGNFQVLASKKIEVHKNCILNYPSALVVFNNKKLTSKTKNETTLIIEEKSTVKGVVAFINQQNKKLVNFKSQIQLKSTAAIYGEVYCTENFELLGSVFGSVYTNNFITKQFGSTYINHIYNGTINSKKLAKQYSGLLFNNNNLSVAKWLY